MKKTIYTFIILLTTFGYSLNAQTNYLTDSEYSSIKFDGVNILDISNSYGNVITMENLFSNSLTIEQGYNEAVEFWIKFSKNSISIEFYNGVEENSSIKYNLASVEVLNNSSSIFIKDQLIKIGDSQNLLANYNFKKLGNQKIFSFTKENFDEYIYIYVDAISDKVIKIGFDGNLL